VYLQICVTSIPLSFALAALIQLPLSLNMAAGQVETGDLKSTIPWWETVNPDQNMIATLLPLWYWETKNPYSQTNSETWYHNQKVTLTDQLHLLQLTSIQHYALKNAVTSSNKLSYGTVSIRKDTFIIIYISRIKICTCNLVMSLSVFTYTYSRDAELDSVY
jgi:hypothetical protein